MGHLAGTAPLLGTTHVPVLAYIDISSRVDTTRFLFSTSVAKQLRKKTLPQPQVEESDLGMADQSSSSLLDCALKLTAAASQRASKCHQLGTVVASLNQQLTKTQLQRGAKITATVSAIIRA